MSPCLEIVDIIGKGMAGTVVTMKISPFARGEGVKARIATWARTRGRKNQGSLSHRHHRPFPWIHRLFGVTVRSR